MKIKTLIVDDEKDARVALELIIKEFFSEDLDLLPSVNGVKEAVKSININKPELILLDVEMPDESGFQLFDYFKECNFEVIFTTAHHKYAMQAFRYAALDYLLKPIDFRQLAIAIQRFKARNKDHNKVKIETFVSNLSNDLEINKKVLFPFKNGYQIEKISNIQFCKADVSYTEVYTLENKTFTIASTLKSIEEILPSSIFFRIHKSYLVNMNCIKTYDKKKSVIILESGIELDVATRRIDEFLEALKIN
jgi:two-component system LytT family response regulator